MNRFKVTHSYSASIWESQNNLSWSHWSAADSALLLHLQLLNDAAQLLDLWVIVVDKIPAVVGKLRVVHESGSQRGHVPFGACCWTALTEEASQLFIQRVAS